MKLSKQDVKPLEAFDYQAFSHWLRRGFEDLYHEDRRLNAFAPLNYFVGRQDDVTRELKDIYDSLSGTARECFRVGIAAALSSLPPDRQSMRTVRGLLHLAGRVHAAEILPEAIKQIGNGFFGLPEYNETSELFALTLDIVAGMSPATLVGDAVRRLVGSSFFRSGYAPRAFIALCHAEPEKFPIHLDLLRGDFTALHQETGTDNAFITARRFAHYVDLNLIATNLWKLFLSTNPKISHLSTDNWLAEALFLQDKKVLLLEKHGESIVIARHEEKQIPKWWKIDLPEQDPEVWSRVEDVRKFLNRCLEHTRREMWDKVFLETGDRNQKAKNNILILRDNSSLYPPPQKLAVGA